MPDIIVVSSEKNAGISTIAAGLARRTGADVAPVEGDVSAAIAANAGLPAVLVATPSAVPEAVAGEVRATSALAGVILNHVPARSVESLRATYEGLGLRPLAVVAEDRVLASPTVGQFAEALGATGEFIDENRDNALARPVIASIAADPGQTYYDRVEAQSVIVRSDKPDLLLSALNAGARCLVVTGDLPVLSYVLDRVREEEIPLIRSPKDTKETVAVLEGLFGAAPFRGADKEARIAELLAGVDTDTILQRSANPA
jgi:BioD-like phosphotransacetylase family protein